MKKLFSIILTAVMLMAIAITPAYACGSCAQEGSAEYLFLERYPSLNDDNFTFEEVYRYDNPDSDYYYDDWILVRASLNYRSALNVKELIGDRIFTGEQDAPFSYGYAIFEYKNGGRFKELDSSCLMLYDGLMEALEEANVGRPVGDADFDNELSILDATYIQRALAKLCDFNKLDDITDYCVNVTHDSDTINFVSDMNMDGEVNILDASAIQQKLVNKKLSSDFRDEAILGDCELDGYVDKNRLTGNGNVYCMIGPNHPLDSWCGDENLLAEEHLCKIWQIKGDLVYFAFDIPDYYNIISGECYTYVYYNDDREVLFTGTMYP